MNDAYISQCDMAKEPRMINLKSPLLLLSLLLGLSAFTACATTPLQPVQGQVLEEGTNKPIANALVVGLWHGTVSHGFVDARTVCYHVETATTDESGRFALPPTEKEYKYRDGHHYTSTIAYKPGYQYARVQRTKGVDYLQPFQGTREERLKVIRTAGATCVGAGESQKNLLPLYRTLYEEARALAVTKQDKQVVNALLHQIDLIELPYAEVLKRDDERYKALRKEFPNE